MEKIDIKKVRCLAKIAGTTLSVMGAMLMTLFKGPLVKLMWSEHIHPKKSYVTDTTGTTDKDWAKGSILLIIATLAWSALFVLQSHTLKTYKNHQLSLTTLICFMGTLQAIAVTFVMEHDMSVWQIGWDMNLLAAAYAGIVTSSISYYVQGLVIKMRGPVFATAFSPLMMIVVAIMGSFILAEKIFLGGIVGSILIVIGLYSVLWGKHKEVDVIEEDQRSNCSHSDEEIPEAIKHVTANGNDNTMFTMKTSIELDHNDDVESQKREADKLHCSLKNISMPSNLNQKT